jgi:hypothetical protein
MSVEFKPFDRSNPPASGVYWFALNRPEWDYDVDDYGKTIGQLTGKTEQLVVMANLEVFMLDCEFSPTDKYNFGEISDEDQVTHYAEVCVPEHPNK